MKNPEAEQLVLPHDEEPLAVLASHRLLLSSEQQIGTDYSEEAIPERDPAYRLSDGTHCETQTVVYMPAAERLALARHLEQLGMSRARAEFVASL